MADPATILARLKGLTGPDREVDADIDAFLFGGRAAHTFTEDTPGARLRRSYSANAVFDHTDPETNGGHVLSRMVRHAGPFTASVDAALALVEKVLPTWQIEQLSWEPVKGGGCICSIGNFGTGDEYQCAMSDHIAPTPSLAILIALFTYLSDASPALATASEEKGR